MYQVYYSIYAVEHFSRDGKAHSFLMKVEEGKDAGCILDLPKGAAFATEEIHFVDAPYSTFMTAYNRQGVRVNDGTYKFQGYISGHKADIERLWERVLGLFPAFNRREIPFAANPELPYQFNCRSGTEAGLKAMGLNFLLVDETMPREGLGKNLLTHLHVA